MRPIQSLIKLSPALLAVLFLAAPAPAMADIPCCVIKAINARTGVVTAAENKDGRTFEFKVIDGKLLRTLKVSQPVYANYQTKQVSLDGKNACCSILNVTSARQGSPTLTPGPRAAPLNPAPPVPSAGGVKPHGVAGTKSNTSQGCVQWLPKYAGMFCRGNDATRPALLLFHGLHQTKETWTKPSSTQYNFDYRHHPKDRDLGKHSAPNAGLYKVGASDKYDVDSSNWLDFLVQQGFTVATWSQPCCKFDNAYPSAQEVFDQFVKDTAAMNPSAPPPIALIGHSRGGLVIRMLLKEKQSAGGRVHWVVTLHSPHHGSEVSRSPDAIAEAAAELFNNIQLPPEVKHPLKELTLQLVRPLRWFMDDESRELAPGGSLVTRLEQGEGPVPGVEYYTFGGVNPVLYRQYTWLFTPMSAVPQYRDLEQYFKWEAKATEVTLVSPMLTRVRPVLPEIKEGVGDSLVTDASARLPFSVHETDQLNHAEVLWNRDIQRKVAGILLRSGHPGPRVPPAGKIQ